jgi:exopolyphosphatase / guanosine-5'-triphosphate,3'-diphosphate pyrophosphatase
MIVVASCLIDFILHHVHVQSIRCSHFSLKEGAVSRMLSGEISL